MKAVIYSRVSTDEQTTENQTPILREWAAQLNFLAGAGHVSEPIEVVEVYSENESAWKSGHQAELARLLIDASRGKFKVVLVWALDRLTRSGIHAIFELVHKLSRLGVRVYSYSETWTLTPSAVEYDLLLAMTAWIAKYESKRRSDRTKAGIERKRRESGKWGRPRGSKDTKRRKRRTVKI